LAIDLNQGSKPLFALNWLGTRPKIAICVMYTFLKIFVVVLLALALLDWLADRDRRASASIPSATPGWTLLSSDIKFASPPTVNENPKGNVPPGESFLPGDIKYESPNGNVRIYFPIVTSIVLSVLFTLILNLLGGFSRSSSSADTINSDAPR
jgi:Protein of unknown function (DUF2905)